MWNVLFSIISRTCDRLLIGKSFWKGLAMPTFLYWSKVICYTKTEIQKLQVLDNKIYRGILATPSSTAAEGPRGNILHKYIISCRKRHKNKLMFAKHFLSENTNTLVRYLFSQQLQNEDIKWIRQLKVYIELTNLSIQDLKEMKFADVKVVANEWETLLWREATAMKSTPRLYCQYN